MQNFDLSTIYFSKKALKKVIKSKNKKICRHYLTAIEFNTRDGFFNRSPFFMEKDSFLGIGKNSFKQIHEEYESLGVLEVTKGYSGRINYRVPDSYPKQVADWFSLDGGFLKLERDSLNKILEKCSDNEIKVLLTFLMIKEAVGSEIVETYPKVLRDSHMNIGQQTLRKCLGSLEEKGFISIAECVDKIKRAHNRFIVVVKKISEVLESQKITVPSQEKQPRSSQNPENSIHLKENNFKKEIKLNQGEQNSVENFKGKKKMSDFDFFGLGNLDRPMTKRTFEKLVLETGLSEDEVKLSLKNFSEYINSDEEIMNQYRNPVGFLCSHMRQFKNVFVAPEWWLNLRGREYLGLDRFKSKGRVGLERKREESSKLAMSQDELSSFFSNLGNIING